MVVFTINSITLILKHFLLYCNLKYRQTGDMYIHCIYSWQTGGMFMEEGFTTFEEELPVGAHCVFKGAATPANGPASCLDPAIILYENNTSCQMTSKAD